MAMATVTCKCRECGEFFKVTTEMHKRRDADAWEEWAKENCDLCRRCFAAKSRDAETKRISDKLAAIGVTLPAITGVSDKQIAYANALRRDYLRREISTVTWIYPIVTNPAWPERAEADLKSSESGMTLSQYISANPHIKIARILFTLTNASDVIDLLKKS